MQSIGFDLALDLQGLFKSGWITGNSGARRKIGFNPANTREGSHIFLNEWLQWYQVILAKMLLYN